MPYKDPKRKRQWECEHREERNARRRKHYMAGPMVPSVPRPAPYPISHQELGSAWEIMAGMVVIALAVGLALLMAWNKSGSRSDDPKSEPSNP